jgi:hypothetical protein
MYSLSFFIFLFFIQMTVIGRANLQKNRAEQKHYQQRSCSCQQNCNRPHKHTMVLHACKFFLVIFPFRAAQTQFGVWRFLATGFNTESICHCSYKPVLRNIESNLIKMKQDGSVVVQWKESSLLEMLLIFYQFVAILCIRILAKHCLVLGTSITCI